MSYLDFPRINFSGAFTAGPSTINNTNDNYILGQQPLVPGFNPNGNAFFKIGPQPDLPQESCKITSVFGSLHDVGDESPLVGQPVMSTDNW